MVGVAGLEAGAELAGAVGEADTEVVRGAGALAGAGLLGGGGAPAGADVLGEAGAEVHGEDEGLADGDGLADVEGLGEFQALAAGMVTLAEAGALAKALQAARLTAVSPRLVPAPAIAVLIFIMAPYACGVEHLGFPACIRENAVY
jgi:hypothetical protein